MAQVIQLKRSAVASAAPASLADGEMAINTLDKKLFAKDSAGNVFEIAGASYSKKADSFAVTGDAAGTGTVGSGVELTLATVNSNVGEFGMVTVNGKGLVTSARALTASDIPTLTAAKISDLSTAILSTNLNDFAAPDGNVSINGHKLTNVAAPTDSADAANKAYVDQIATLSIKWKNPVRVATTANIDLASAPAAIDGVTLANGDRVLVKNQTAGAENGIYVFNGSGSAMTRAEDFDSSSNPDEVSGATVIVTEGTTYDNLQFTLATHGTITLGTTTLDFVQSSGAGQIEAGAGMTKTGNTLAVGGTAGRITVNADSVDISADYVGQASITTVGTITTGVWNGTTVDVEHGGTGATTFTSKGIVYGNGTGALQVTNAGSQYQSLIAGADGTPAFGALALNQSAAVSGQLGLANGGLNANLSSLGAGDAGKFLAYNHTNGNFEAVNVVDGGTY